LFKPKSTIAGGEWHRGGQPARERKGVAKGTHRETGVKKQGKGPFKHLGGKPRSAVRGGVKKKKTNAWTSEVWVTPLWGKKTAKVPQLQSKQQTK